MVQAYERAKKEMIARYLQTRQAILEAADALPVEAHNTAFVGEWTIKELLAHLSGWDYTYLDAFQEILRGELPDFFSHYDHNWQSYNNRMVSQYRQSDLPAAIAGVRESQARLVAFLEELPSEKVFDDCGICTENGFHVTISGLMESIIMEEKEHLEQVQALAASLTQQPEEGYAAP